MNTCETCKHYERDDYKWQVRDPNGKFEHSSIDDPLPWGACALARTGYEVMTGQGDGYRTPSVEAAAPLKFFPSDASSYSAMLNVRPDFGCNQWEGDDA